MAKIHLKRDSSRFFTRRTYNIYIDDKNVGQIYRREDKYFEIAEGKHTIQAKMDLRYSQKVSVEVRNGETINIVASEIKISDFLLTFFLPAILIIFSINYFFKLNFDKIYFILFYAMLYLIYSFTIGREKQLTLMIEK